MQKHYAARFFFRFNFSKNKWKLTKNFYSPILNLRRPPNISGGDNNATQRTARDPFPDGQELGGGDGPVRDKPAGAGALPHGGGATGFCPDLPAPLRETFSPGAGGDTGSGKRPELPGGGTGGGAFFHVCPRAPKSLYLLCGIQSKRGILGQKQ